MTKLEAHLDIQEKPALALTGADEPGAPAQWCFGQLSSPSAIRLLICAGSALRTDMDGRKFLQKKLLNGLSDAA